MIVLSIPRRFRGHPRTPSPRYLTRARALPVPVAPATRVVRRPLPRAFSSPQCPPPVATQPPVPAPVPIPIAGLSTVAQTRPLAHFLF